MPVEDQILQIGTYLQIDLFKECKSMLPILLNERDSSTS